MRVTTNHFLATVTDPLLERESLEFDTKKGKRQMP